MQQQVTAPSALASSLQSMEEMWKPWRCKRAGGAGEIGGEYQGIVDAEERWRRGFGGIDGKGMEAGEGAGLHPSGIEQQHVRGD